MQATQISGSGGIGADVSMAAAWLVRRGAALMRWTGGWCEAAVSTSSALAASYAKTASFVLYDKDVICKPSNTVFNAGRWLRIEPGFDRFGRDIRHNYSTI